MDDVTTVDEDELQFKHPFTMKLSGNRRTGKTHFTKTLLLMNRELITPSIDIILWFYASRQQDVFNEIEEALHRGQQRIEFVHGLPRDGRTLQDVVAEHRGRKLFVLDDLMEQASNRADVAALFTNGRHEDVSVIFLTQNLFHKGKYSRDIALNTDYMVNFKNPRDASVITNLARQMGNVKFLQQAYRDATKDAFTHLFLDFRSDTRDALRYRSRVLHDTQTVYQPL